MRSQSSASCTSTSESSQNATHFFGVLRPLGVGLGRGVGSLRQLFMLFVDSGALGVVRVYVGGLARPLVAAFQAVRLDAGRYESRSQGVIPTTPPFLK